MAGIEAADNTKTGYAWQPDSQTIEHANLSRFMKNHRIHYYADLMQRSTDDIRWFTQAVIEFLDIQFSHPYGELLDLSSGIALPRWCVGGRMNIIHNCLDKRAGTATDDRPALRYESEKGMVEVWSYRQLREEVNRTANALRLLGLGKGDTIGIYMPMIPEIIASLLAIAKIGAISLPLFSGFAEGALISRLSDADAKALITADGTHRRGRPVPMKSVADLAAAKIPTLQYMLVTTRAGLSINLRNGHDYRWDELVSSQSATAVAEATSADDPLMIIYTSGTTGQPKGAVHTHCSFPIKAAQDMAFGTDVHPGDVIYWVTDLGWMMGPWLAFGSLLLGATMLIYDGAPDYPSPDRLWSLVNRHRVNQLGISPSLIRSLMQHGDQYPASHDLSSLKLFASTGEPWNSKPWWWLFKTVGNERLPIINYSGGTEISGGILMGNPILPEKPAAFSAACPGMAADVFDEQGRSIVGHVGELVVKAPWIGMTRGFWRETDRYLATYWSRWPDVWLHGDWAQVDPDGQWYIFGRSDDTLKIAGKRLGPAEVETIAVSHTAVLEAAAIGVPDEIKGEQLMVLCVLRAGVNPGPSLEMEIRDLLAHTFGKALAPRRILFVPDLPKTRNAKVMRRMIRAACMGHDPGDTASLLNPESLEMIASAFRSESVQQ